MDALVGGRQPCSQGAQALLAEIRPFDRLRNGSAADPPGDVADVEREAGFDCRPVELAEHAAPVPLGKQLADRIVLPIWPKLREECCQWDELRLIRQVAGAK